MLAMSCPVSRSSRREETKRTKTMNKSTRSRRRKRTKMNQRLLKSLQSQARRSDTSLVWSKVYYQVVSNPQLQRPLGLVVAALFYCPYFDLSLSADNTNGVSHQIRKVSFPQTQHLNFVVVETNPRTPDLFHLQVWWVAPYNVFKFELNWVLKILV